MKPDYLGYVLNALDPQSQAEVEAHVRSHPEAQSQVETLRHNLEPLALDAGKVPPSGLADRTLACIVALETPPLYKEPPRIHRLPWRRIVEIAAVFLFASTALGLGVTWIGKLRIQRLGDEPNAAQVVACTDNMHKLFVSLRAYGDIHNGQFPHVATTAEVPPNVPGLVFSKLQDGGLRPSDLTDFCPAGAMGGNAPGAPKTAYAYSIGYRQGDKIVGPHLEEGKPNASMPLLADGSPLDPVHGGQSMNHGGWGQNVLYCDGHVAFCQSRFVGVNNDDIYLNRSMKVAPGIDWSDAVLTTGAVPP